MLVLFDIDGTLLHGRPEGHTRAMVDAMARVWAVPVEPDDVWRIDPPGRTDREIARLVLRAHGVGDGDIDAGMAEWMLIAARLHDEVAGDHPAPVAAADAAHVTAALRDGGTEIALLTGNLEPIGRAKVAAAGLDGRFGPGGGFGSDAEARADLVGVARSRAAGNYRDDEVVIVGDTPRDIAAARAAGVRVVAVTTGAFGPDVLAGADGVADDLTGALGILTA
ncbi:MAG: HAD family hydrolase [Actinomycetota bacterium]